MNVQSPSNYSILDSITPKLDAAEVEILKLN